MPKGKRYLLFASMMVAIGWLVGCIGPLAPCPPEPTPPAVAEPVDYALVGTANYVPAEPGDDPYPLFVGARWVYRNATSFWNPQIAASGLMESEVVAEVQGEGVQCYVLHTRYSNGPDEYIYLHRSPNAVNLRGTRLGAAPGSQPRFSLDPGLAVLSLPLEEDKQWSLQFKEGSVEATVFHPEVVAIETGEVSTLLGSYTTIFQGAWRVHYELFGTAPRLFGGPQQFLWYAPGVGVVKHVLNSVNYELAEFRLPQEVVALNESDQTATVPEGGVLIVQVRGVSPDRAASGVWRLESGGSGGVLDWIDDTFYPDQEPIHDGAGSYAFRFRAIGTGEATVSFVRLNQETGVTEDRIDVAVRVE